MDSPVDVIINADAGGTGDQRSRRDLARLIDSSFHGAEVSFPDEGSKISGLAKQAVDRGSKTIIAGGGDGTMSAVASVLAGTDATLGVLPLGTLNHFAKDLGIPLNLEDAVHGLAAGRVRYVDVGEVNGRVFINNSGLGLYPEIVRRREARQARGEPKWAAALVSVLKSLIRYRLLSIRVIVKGRQLTRKTPIVFIGNNRYEIEGLNIGVRTRLDAGELSLYIPHVQTRFGMLWFALRALAGKQVANMDLLLEKELLIESRHRQIEVSLDGETALLDVPLRYRVREGALKVIVPDHGK